MRIRITLLVVAVCQALVQGALAEDMYPSKRVRVIVPFSPGGINDFAARSVSNGLTQSLKVPVVVDNRPGAGGVLGTQIAAAAPPDGYTVIVGSVASHAIQQSLLKKPPYDVLRDFVPIIQIAYTPLVVVVHPSMPVKSIAELIKVGKSGQNPLNYASSGVGTATHLAAELFATMAKLRLVHVPYKGAGPAIIDVMGGQLPLMFATMPSALSQVKAGKLRALAVTSPTRFSSAPDLPTVDEAGIPGYAVTSWSGMFAPAGTPHAVAKRLASEVDEILRTPASKKYFFSQGAESVGGTPEEFSMFVEKEIAKWKKVVAISGASAD